MKKSSAVFRNDTKQEPIKTSAVTIYRLEAAPDGKGAHGLWITVGIAVGRLFASLLQGE